MFVSEGTPEHSFLNLPGNINDGKCIREGLQRKIMLTPTFYHVHFLQNFLKLSEQQLFQTT